ncbi:MAG TPA: hypothetical protein DCS07_02345, partial [Bdellovibrionales bacterium]|nr:hypothetical protein [Bdellovibrionales bacterium]
MSLFKNVSTLLLLLLLAFGISACGDVSDDELSEPVVSEADSWPYPNVKGGDVQGEKNFAYLVNNHLVGKASPTPWAGFWWPYGGNGIAAGKYTGGLSPAGKYDAARGGRTHAQSWEVANHGSAVPKIQPWWGHCNGWSAAAALFEEPRSNVTVNGIEFNVADLKALLTEAAMEVSADFFGDRVDWGSDYSSPKLYDTVPDQYFLVLTNYMGRLKQSVLIDRYTTDQVWNQPVPGYQFEYPKPSDYLGADPQAPNVYRILMTSTIYWARDDVTPEVLTVPFNFEANEHFESRVLKMELWLDGPVVFGPDGKVQSSGNLIVTRQGDFFVGGAWKMGDGAYSDAWPDYMWVPYSVLKPTEYANPWLDMDWIRKHLLVPGGADDPSVNARPVEPAPSVRPSPSSSPSGSPNPWPFPTWTPTPRPTSFPTGGPTAGPTFDPIPLPTAGPTSGPRPTFGPA